MTVKARAPKDWRAASRSECRRRVDPEDARALLPDVAVVVRQLGAEDEAVAGGELVVVGVDDQLDLAGEHIAYLLAGVLDGAGALAAYLDVVDIALEHVTG